MCAGGRIVKKTFKISLARMKVMEKSVIFLQSLLVLFLAKYVTSSMTNCTCQLPQDFCKPNITAVQGKVLGSQPADSNGSLPSDINDAYKTRYRVNLTQIMINGTHELKLENNTFKISVRNNDSCLFNFTIRSSHVFLGNVNPNGKWSKLYCTLPITTRNPRNGKRDLTLVGEDMNFSDLCNPG